MTFRLLGRFALFAATAISLLQSTCTISSALPTNSNQAVPIHAGCHESTPVSPPAPNPGRQCCSGKHSPEAILTAAVVTNAPLVPTEFVAASYSILSEPYQPAAEILTSRAGPPGFSILRI